MNADRRALVRIALLAALPWVLFGACAEGTEIPGTTTGGAGAGGPDGGIPPGKIGAVCEEDQDCNEGACIQVGTTKYCSVACPPACPVGTYCAIIEGDPICVPDLGQQCQQCNAPIDCASPSDACLTSPHGDKFCAIDCTTLGVCPPGYACMEATVYQSGGGFGGSGGAGGAGGGSAGGAGGAGGGSAGAAPMPPPPSGVPYMFCVPEGGQSCGCDEQRDGVTHACYVENEHGKCTGTETCNGMLGAWEGCDAKTPEAEVCNALDDDCDEEIDNAAPDQLCGPLPPHGGWACNAGTCDLAGCDPGWTQYPAGAPADGCPCSIEPEEPNDTCADAKSAGQVTDAAANSVVINGTLSSDTDVDVWIVDTVDTAQGSTNTYHVSIDFTAPMPNDEFIVDVLRGGACQDAPMGPSTAITSYDWCVDGNAGGEGEINCGPTAPVHCGNHTATYYLRVYRRPGAAGTCTPYQITVTATGGDPCDFTQKCP